MPTFAAVDIGSNSVRLKIARLTRGRLRSIHEDREVTRLGEGVFRSGFLTPESMAETVKVLRRFHRATQQVVTDPVCRLTLDLVQELHQTRGSFLGPNTVTVDEHLGDGRPQ